MKMVVSLHDVHPSSLAQVAQQRAALKAIGVRKTSLLVVPYWHRGEPMEEDVDFVKTLTRWRDEGDEIVLHGWTHSCEGMRETPGDLYWTRLYTNYEAEFLLAGPEECRIRLVTGRALFEKFGWSVVGFIAPAWLMAQHVPDILRELGFAYTVTRTELIPLGRGSAPLHSPSLCYSTRSAWRRAASLGWNRSLAQSLRRRPLMRVSLHPDDVIHRRVWRQAMKLIEAGVHQGRAAVTYRDCVADRVQALRPVSG